MTLVVKRGEVSIGWCICVIKEREGVSRDKRETCMGR